MCVCVCVCVLIHLQLLEQSYLSGTNSPGFNHLLTNNVLKKKA